jgi:diguanylate cyclase (GGDEF)-like protein
MSNDQINLESSSHINKVMQSNIDIKSILDGLPDPALYVDIDGNVLTYNTTFFEFFSIRPRQLQTLLEQDESLKNAIQGLFDINKETIKSLFQTQTVKQIADVFYRMDDGRIFKGMRSLIPVLTIDKQCCGVIIYFRDFSPEAKMQERYERVLIEEKKYTEDLERKVSEKTEKLTQALKEVTFFSRTDALTGLLNRQVFMDLTQKSIEIAQRYEENLAILMLDLDHFKLLNDTYGHQAGDRVLQSSTKRLKEILRESDYIGRYGGEEFIVCIKTNSMDIVDQLGKRCLDAVRFLPISTVVPGKTDFQTISIGCALFPLHGATLNELIKCADDALYEAKNRGRDQMVIYSAPTLNQS